MGNGKRMRRRQPEPDSSRPGSAQEPGDTAVSDPFFKQPILNSPYDYPSRHREIAAQGTHARRDEGPR